MKCSALYSSLKNRQASVKRVLPLHIGGQTVQYTMWIMMPKLLQAKRKAADILQCPWPKTDGRQNQGILQAGIL